MPLSLSIRIDQQIEVRQTFDSPTVYLDHWAVRRLSDDHVLQDRFVGALHAARGTLFLSHQNFVEFVGPEDASHATQAEHFLDRVLPNIYFAQLDLKKAIAQEQDPRAKGLKLIPPPDLELLKILALQRPADPKPFTIKGLLTEVAANRARLGKTFTETNQAIVDKVIEQRRNTEFVKKAKTFKPGEDHARTLVVMGELLRGVILDPTMPFTPQDASDYQHAILSTCYCDYVLLDGKWQAMVRATAQRIATMGLSFKTARCFSERRGGLEEFLVELEARAPVPPRTAPTCAT